STAEATARILGEPMRRSVCRAHVSVQLALPAPADDWLHGIHAERDPTDVYASRYCSYVGSITTRVLEQSRMDLLASPTIFEQLEEQREWMQALMKPTVVEQLRQHEERMRLFARPTIFEQLEEQRERMPALMKPTVVEQLRQHEERMRLFARPMIFKQLQEHQERMRAV